jgi:hypothetical protein
MEKQQRKQAKVVIQCPNPKCGATDEIYLIQATTEASRVHTDEWVEGQSSEVYIGETETTDYGESHLYCHRCSTEWGVPTEATLVW